MNITRSYAAEYALLALFIACFLFTQAIFYGQYYYNPDELINYQISAAPSVSSVLTQAHFEPHPPLSFLLRHFWFQVAGNGLGATRLLSAILVSISAVLLYHCGRLIKNSNAGLLAAALLLFSPAGVVIGYNVRLYALLSVLLICSYYAYLRYQRTGARKFLGLYAASGMLAACTHMLPILFYFVLTLSHLWQNRRLGFIRLMPWGCVNLLIALITVYFASHQSWVTHLYVLDNLTMRERGISWLATVSFDAVSNVLLACIPYFILGWFPSYLAVLLIVYCVFNVEPYTPKENRLILPLLLIILCLYLSSIIFLDGFRRVYFVIPLILLSIAQTIERFAGAWLTRLTSRKRYGLWCLIALLGAWGNTHYFFVGNTREIHVTPSEYASFEQFRRQSLTGRDAVVLGRFSANAWAGEKGSVYDLLPQLLTKQLIAFPSDNGAKAYFLTTQTNVDSKEALIELLQAIYAQPGAKNYENIWFYSMHEGTYVPYRISKCGALQEKIKAYPGNNLYLTLVGVPADIVFNGGDIAHSPIVSCL